MQRDPQANLVVTPADAYVNDVEEYRRIIRGALAFASMGERIVTIGIRPTRPETGYGYIAAGEALAGVFGEAVDGASAVSDGMAPATSAGGYDVRKVASFREKPDLQTAREYLAASNYFWNAGIFVWNVDTIVKSIRRFSPDLAAKMDTMAASFYTPQEDMVVREIFPTCENISIDYAVMEKADYIYTFPADFGWSDVGTWGALWTLLDHDDDGNAVIGANVHLHDCYGCIVHAPNATNVVLEGLRYCIVVEREGRLLVCRLSEEQRIKDFVR